ncbi:MAG: hypothetical protein GWN53_07535 [Gammaproteobacteria bacterium]|nr:hypothetical protein [Gammaproteobacteria bacterium]
MAGDSATSPKAAWYRQPLVWLIILIPASSVLMGAATLVLAIRSFDGMVVDDYYRQGLQINRSLERDRAAARHGLGGTMRMDEGRGRIRTTLAADRGFRPPAALRLNLFHATRSGFDREVLLRRVTAQQYEGTLPKLVPGRWYLQLEADDWRLTGSFEVPGSDTVTVKSDSS